MIFSFEHMPEPQQQGLWQCDFVSPVQRICDLKRIAYRQKGDRADIHFVQDRRHERNKSACPRVFDNDQWFVTELVDEQLFYFLTTRLCCL